MELLDLMLDFVLVCGRGLLAHLVAFCEATSARTGCLYRLICDLVMVVMMVPSRAWLHLGLDGLSGCWQSWTRLLLPPSVHKAIQLV